MKKRLLGLLSLTIALLLVFAGCTNNATEPTPGDDKSPVKVGFIYVGPVGDGGYTYAHNEGRLYLEEQLGVETIIQESVNDQDDSCVEVARNMIDQGCNVIIATSFGYMDYIKSIAPEYPDVKFLHCSGYEQAENMSNYFGRIYQPRFLSGLVAGLKTETNKIGYVAAFDIPEVVRGINAFTLGVRAVNPEAEVHVRWSHTWVDPVKEKEAAIALLDENCDVIAQHQDTTAPQLAAEERGVWSVGYNTDMSAQAPEANMTGPIWNWGIYYVDQITAIQNGTWEASSYWGGMHDDIVRLAPLTKNAPENAQATVDEYSAKIIDGSFHVFAGPINNQNGEIMVAEGETMSDGDMLSMNWFVEGVVGSIESK